MRMDSLWCCESLSTSRAQGAIPGSTYLLLLIRFALAIGALHPCSIVLKRAHSSVIVGRSELFGMSGRWPAAHGSSDAAPAPAQICHGRC